MENPDEHGQILLRLARSAIAARLDQHLAVDDSADWLDQPGATFVTLTRMGRLRGCIGSLHPRRSLVEDVRHNAVAAAFADPRFPPVDAEDLPHLRIEVSQLSAAEPVPNTSRDQVLRSLRPGMDGVVVSWRGHRGTFLPQVWEQLPEPATFLDHLLSKAGLPASFWSPDIEVRRYQVTSFAEPEHVPEATP